MNRDYSSLIIDKTRNDYSPLGDYNGDYKKEYTS